MRKDFSTGGELAVGECPRAPLAEVDMALRIKDAPFPEASDIGDSFLHGLAPFHEEGRKTASGQRQGCKQAGRSGPDDDRPTTSPGNRRDRQGDRVG